MSLNKFAIQAIVPFQWEAKPLIKKFASLKSEPYALNEVLATNPTAGTPFGQNCYKIRLRIASKGKGSGGARVITCVVVVTDTVYLLSIYDKSEQESLSGKRLQELLRLVPLAA